jgi:hypothetical protein
MDSTGAWRPGGWKSVFWASQSEEQDFQNLRWRLRCRSCRWYRLFRTFSLLFEMGKVQDVGKIFEVGGFPDIALTDPAVL